MVGKLNNNLTTLGNKLADFIKLIIANQSSPQTVTLQASGVYLLLSSSANAGYQCVYLITSDATTPNIIPLKTVTSVTITASSNRNITISTTVGTSLYFYLINFSKFNS